MSKSETFIEDGKSQAQLEEELGVGEIKPDGKNEKEESDIGNEVK